MNKIRAEQTNTKPQRHTHTRTDGEGMRKISRKKGNREETQPRSGAKREEGHTQEYKQVKSEIACLASQHRGW